MCGIFGVFNYKDASNIVYLGLHALQHRGQESAGIASIDSGGTMRSHRQMGLVSDIFNETVLKQLRGNSAIGHVRYSTAGSSNIGNAQPLMVEYSKGFIAVAHNGNLTNAKIIKEELENYGSIFQSSTDTEVIIHLVALSHENSTLDRLIDPGRHPGRQAGHGRHRLFLRLSLQMRRRNHRRVRAGRRPGPGAGLNQFEEDAALHVVGEAVFQRPDREAG